MIFTLIGADFSKSNIGTISSWMILRELGAGATYSGPSFVEKNSSFTATVTLAEKYEISSIGIIVTMNGITLDESYYSINDNIITFNIPEVTGSVVIKVPTLNTETGEEDAIPNYVITYEYKCNGITIKEATTENVKMGTVKNFTTDNAPEIEGYTINSVEPTSITIAENTTVTYYYTSKSVFDFNFVTNTLADYANQGIFTIPDTSTVDAITYDSAKGANLNNNLPYGLTLTNPIDASKPWTMEFTGTFVTPTDLVGNRRALITGIDDLTPFVVINGNGGADKIGFQISSGSHTWVGSGQLIYDQEVTYKIVHDGANTTTVYQNDIELGKSNASWTDKTFGTILGVIKGKSSAYIWQDVESGKKSYLKKFKFYYN